MTPSFSPGRSSRGRAGLRRCRRALRRAGGSTWCRGDRLAALPGQLRVGVLLELEAGDAPQRGEEALTRMSAEVEDTAANANYRFAAAGAYDALVRRRVAELCEARFQRMPTIGGALGRRPRPGSLNLTENQGRITKPLATSGYSRSGGQPQWAGPRAGPFGSAEIHADFDDLRGPHGLVSRDSACYRKGREFGGPLRVDLTTAANFR